MKKLFTVFAIIAGLALTSGTQAEESDLSIDFGMDYATKYIWRGIEFNEQHVLQPSITLGYGDFAFNIWGNMDLTEEDDNFPTFDGIQGGPNGDNFSEVDFTLSYGTDLCDMVSAEVGVIWYVFPAFDGDWEDSDTAEVYVSFGFNEPIFNPSITVYYDFHAVDGFYVTAGVEHSFVLTDDEKLSFDVAASVGFMDREFAEAYHIDDTGTALDSDIANDFTASAGFSYAVSDNLSLGIAAVYSEIIDGDAVDGAESAFGTAGTENWYGVVSVGYSF